MLMEQTKPAHKNGEYPDPRELALANNALPWLRKQSSRRIWACVTLGASLLFAGAVTIGANGWALGLTLFYLIGNALLRGTTRSILEFPSSALDERMVTVRNERYRTAYRIAFGIFAATIVLPVIAMQWIDLPPNYLIGATLGFFGLLWALPSALFAWTEDEI